MDDLIYIDTHPTMIEEFKKAMMKEYKMIDFGIMKYFLGIQIKQSPRKISITREICRRPTQEIQFE